MADTTFTSGTTIESTWLNEVNDHVYNDTVTSGTTLHSAGKISVADTGGYFTGDTVEEVLAELATVNGLGPTYPASSVTITDQVGYYTSGNVEDALQEIGSDITDLYFGVVSQGPAPLKVMVLGDSFTCNPGHGGNWPDMVARMFERSGIPCNMMNISYGGWTFYKATQSVGNDPDGTPWANWDGKSMLAYAKEQDTPDIIFVSLGFNDAYTNIEGRTLAQSKTSAEQVFYELRAQFPTSWIIYASQLAYDNVNWSGTSTIKHKGTIPYLWTDATMLDSFGGTIAANLEVNLSITEQTKVNDWTSLDLHIKNYLATEPIYAGSTTTFCTLNLFRAIRLGLNQDGIHTTWAGQTLFSGAIWKHLIANKNANARLDGIQEYNIFTDPDELWEQSTDPSGDGYTYVNTENNRMAIVLKSYSVDSYEAFNNWYKQIQEARTPSITVNSNNTFNLRDYSQPFTVNVRNCEPSTTVEFKLDNGAWGNTAIVTDEWGNGVSASSSAATFKTIGINAAGTYTFSYRCASYSKSFTVVVADSQVYSGIAHTRTKYTETNSNYSTTTLNTWAAISDLATTITSTGGKRLIRLSLNLGANATTGASWQYSMDIRLLRGGVEISKWDGAAGHFNAAGQGSHTAQTILEYLDTDTTVGSKAYTVEYRLQSSTANATGYINGVVSTRKSTLTITECEDLT